MAKITWKENMDFMQKKKINISRIKHLLCVHHVGQTNDKESRGLILHFHPYLVFTNYRFHIITP